MPHVLVVTDLPEAGGKLVYRERIASTDFESRHFTDQLAERVGWAVRDADELSRREPEPIDQEESKADELDEPAPPGLTALSA